MKINISEWKPFTVSSIFFLYNGKGITKEEIDCNSGELIAIQSGMENNGSIGRISKKYCIAMKYTLVEEPCLTVARTGSAGFVAYQPFGCVVGDSAKILLLKEKDQRCTAVYLFLRTLLMANQYKYNYGRKVTEEKYLSEILMLPIMSNADGIVLDKEKKYSNQGYIPDWNYMKKLIKSLHYKPIKTHNKNVIDNDKISTNWQKFDFGKIIAKIYKAKAYAKIEFETETNKCIGRLPFVSRTETNNGVDCYVSESDFPKKEEGNAILIGDTTATITYQLEPFVTGDHMIVIRANWLNKYTGLFIVSLLQRERFRYSYGRAFLMDSIKSTKIMLPVKHDKNGIIIDKDKKYSDNGYIPDWEYMENYIKALPYGDRI